MDWFDKGGDDDEHAKEDDADDVDVAVIIIELHSRRDRRGRDGQTVHSDHITKCSEVKKKGAYKMYSKHIQIYLSQGGWKIFAIFLINIYRVFF